METGDAEMIAIVEQDDDGTVWMHQATFKRFWRGVSERNFTTAEGVKFRTFEEAAKWAGK